MSFPAYESFGKDIQLGFARWKVYMHLVHGPVLNFVTPTEVKVAGLEASLKMSKRKIIDALDWLVERGYIVEHGRHERRVRSLTLAWTLKPEQAA